ISLRSSYYIFGKVHWDWLKAGRGVLINTWIEYASKICGLKTYQLPFRLKRYQLHHSYKALLNLAKAKQI
ncbi:hypothetical protein NQ317_011868, partial [Molorchus minor]